MSRVSRRVAVVVASTLTVLAITAAPALAHVTVHSDGPAVQGGFSELSFRVPNEQDGAATIELQVMFPTDAPLGFVSVKPHPGWHYQVQTRELTTPIQTGDGPVTQTASAITWTADSPASALQPGQFDDFDVSAGPLPKTTTMTFKAIQTYSNGDVVRWIETAAAGAPEPDHPAPVLHLVTSGDAVSAATGTSSGDATTSRLAAATQPDPADGTNRALAIAALVVSVTAAAGTGLVAARRRGAR